MEYALPPQALDALFQRTAQRQYTRELLFYCVAELMALGICRVHRSVHQAYQAHKDELGVSITALYGKLDRFLLGLVLQEGQGVPRDSLAESRLIDRACSFGHQQACNLSSAALERECGRDQATICVTQGLRYLKGESVPKKRSRGLGILRKGCENQTIPGCANLVP